MWPATAALVAVTLASQPGADRVLVCRPVVHGDPALARGDALVEALRDRARRLLDYGVPCDTAAEAARAARRAGLAHAVRGAFAGRTDGSTFELTVVAADERTLEVRRLDLPPGADAAEALGAALDGILAELRRPETEAFRRRISAGIAGGGAALLAAGTVLAVIARGRADAANRATAPEEYLSARDAWRTARGASAGAFALGGAALAAGLTWRLGSAKGE